MIYDPLVELGIEEAPEVAPGQGDATRDSAGFVNPTMRGPWTTNSKDSKIKQILDVLTVSPEARYLQRATVAGATGGLGMGPAWPVGALLGIISEDPNFAMGQGAVNKAVSKLVKAGQLSSLSRGGRAAVGAGLGVAQTLAGAGATKALDLIPGNPMTPTGNTPPRTPGMTELGLSAVIPGLAEARAAMKARKPAFQLTQKITGAAEEAVGESLPLSIGGTKQPITDKVTASKNKMLSEMQRAGGALKAMDYRPEYKAEASKLATVDLPRAQWTEKVAGTDLRQYQAEFNSIFKDMRATDRAANKLAIADTTIDYNDRIADLRAEVARLKTASGAGAAKASGDLADEQFDLTRKLQDLATEKAELEVERKSLGRGGEERLAAINSRLDEIKIDMAGAKFDPGLAGLAAKESSAGVNARGILSVADAQAELVRLQTEKQNILTQLRANGVTDPERLALPPRVREAQDALAQARQGYDEAVANTYRVQREQIDVAEQLKRQETMWASVPDDVQRDMAAAIGAVNQTAPEVFDAAWGQALRGRGDLSEVPRRVDELISTLSRSGYADAAKDVRLAFMHDLLAASRDGAGYPTKLYNILERMGPDTARDFFPKLFQAPGLKPGEATRMADSFLHAAGELASLSNGRPAAKGIHISNGFLIYEALKPIVGAGKASAVALFTFGILKQVAIGDLLKKAVEDPIAVDTFLRYSNKYGLVEGLRKSRVASAVFKSLEGQVFPIKEARWNEEQAAESRRGAPAADGRPSASELLDAVAPSPTLAPEVPKGKRPPTARELLEQK